MEREEWNALKTRDTIAAPDGSLYTVLSDPSRLGLVGGLIAVDSRDQSKIFLSERLRYDFTVVHLDPDTFVGEGI